MSEHFCGIVRFSFFLVRGFHIAIESDGGMSLFPPCLVFYLSPSLFYFLVTVKERQRDRNRKTELPAESLLADRTHIVSSCIPVEARIAHQHQRPLAAPGMSTPSYLSPFSFNCTQKQNDELPRQPPCHLSRFVHFILLLYTAVYNNFLSIVVLFCLFP